MSKLSLAEWQEHYHNFKASSLSIGSYAQKNGIPPSSLYSAISRLKKRELIDSNQQIKPKFIKVTANNATVAQVKAIKVTLPSGVEIELGEQNSNNDTISFITSLERSLKEPS